VLREKEIESGRSDILNHVVGRTAGDISLSHLIFQFAEAEKFAAAPGDEVRYAWRV